jgi:hypothetical protein
MSNDQSASRLGIREYTELGTFLLDQVVKAYGEPYSRHVDETLTTLAYVHPGQHRRILFTVWACGEIPDEKLAGGLVIQLCWRGQDESAELQEIASWGLTTVTIGGGELAIKRLLPSTWLWLDHPLLRGIKGNNPFQPSLLDDIITLLGQSLGVSPRP